MLKVHSILLLNSNEKLQRDIQAVAVFETWSLNIKKGQYNLILLDNKPSEIIILNRC